MWLLPSFSQHPLHPGLPCVCEAGLGAANSTPLLWHRLLVESARGHPRQGTERQEERRFSFVVFLRVPFLAVSFPQLPIPVLFFVLFCFES